MGFTREGASGRRRLRLGALIAAVALAAGGMSLAGLAGAEDQPGARQAAYPPNPCDPTESLYAKITQHPKKRTTKKRATFRFKAFFCVNSQEFTGANFKCKLDDSDYKKCTSPKRYRHLHRGRHNFKVKAVAQGFGSSDPDSFSWRIKRG
jgi:hypothetical protein